MRRKINPLQLSAIVGLMFITFNNALADPNIYVCSSGSVTLTYDQTGFQLAAGDQVVWQEFEDATINNPVSGTEQVKTFNGNESDVSLPVASTDISELGSHYYRAYVVSANPANCSGDLSEPVEIYRLPDLTLNLTPLVSAYCENAGTAAQSDITATTTTQDNFVLPADVLLTYSWSATKGTDPVTPVSTLGIEEDDNLTALALTNTFTMNATEVGEYAFSATVAYPAKSASGITIKGGCSANSDAPATVTVTQKPGKPTITVE